MSRFFGFENEGSFEGYVGRDPEPVENKLGDAQCFLHVGQTPRFKGKDGEWKKKRTIWMHFACFGPVAEFCLAYIRTGMRVFVRYEANQRFHPKYKSIVAFNAQRVRPIAEEFIKRDSMDRADALDWRPPTAKGQTKWPDEIPPVPDVEPPEMPGEDEDEALAS